MDQVIGNPSPAEELAEAIVEQRALRRRLAFIDQRIVAISNAAGYSNGHSPARSYYRLLSLTDSVLAQRGESSLLEERELPETTGKWARVTRGGILVGFQELFYSETAQRFVSVPGASRFLNDRCEEVRS